MELFPGDLDICKVYKKEIQMTMENIEHAISYTFTLFFFTIMYLSEVSLKTMQSKIDFEKSTLGATVEKTGAYDE
jgi:hypothetical protein